jgi:hypothetical protein
MIVVISSDHPDVYLTGNTARTEITIHVAPSTRPSLSIHDFSGRHRPESARTNQTPATAGPHGEAKLMVKTPKHMMGSMWPINPFPNLDLITTSETDSPNRSGDTSVPPRKSTFGKLSEIATSTI